jgi:osmotically-inducible protein OsmY
MKPLKSVMLLSIAALLFASLGCASSTSKDGSPSKSNNSSRGDESAGEYLDDSVITTKVKTAIFNEETLKSSEINVETYKGIVQLSGFVNSQADIDKAVTVAKTIKGVTSVKNTMQLKTK